MTIARRTDRTETFDRDPNAYTSSFFVVKRFDVLYREFAANPAFTSAIYALPVAGRDPSSSRVRYAGIDRDPIRPYLKGSLAQIRMAEIAKQQGRDVFDEELLASLPEAEDVLAWTQDEAPGVYEIVWARVAATTEAAPTDFVRQGFEPTYFNYGGHFSALCDALAFPRWHGTDREGTAFREHYERLNVHGLFDDANSATDYLEHYLSFDWTERGDFEIIEVWCREGAIDP